jgi:hypothetical protein
VAGPLVGIFPGRGRGVGRFGCDPQPDNNAQVDSRVARPPNGPKSECEYQKTPGKLGVAVKEVCDG